MEQLEVDEQDGRGEAVLGSATWSKRATIGESLDLSGEPDGNKNDNKEIMSDLVMGTKFTLSVVPQWG